MEMIAGGGMGKIAKLVRVHLKTKLPLPTFS